MDQPKQQGDGVQYFDAQEFCTEMAAAFRALSDTARIFGDEDIATALHEVADVMEIDR